MVQIRVQRSTSLMATLIALFVVLCVAAYPGETAGAVALQQEPPATCTVERTQANYPQTGGRVTVKPLEQHDEAGGTQWVTTWNIKGTAGQAITATVLVFHCTGYIDDLTYCLADRAAYTTTHVVPFVMPAAETTFSVAEPIEPCCELTQADLVSINTVPWGASFFDRKATAPECNLRLTPSPTVSNTPMLPATETPTATPVTPSTPTETPVMPATPTETPVTPATPTETPIVPPTPTPTDTPTWPPTATPLPTETSIVLPTATQTSTPTATPSPAEAVPTLFCGTSTSSTTVGRTSSNAIYSCHSGDYSGPDRVYAITIADGDLTATLAGLDADLDVFILSNLGGDTCLGWGDSSVTLSGLAAGTYYIAVDGAAGVSGAFSLNVACTAPAPPTPTSTPGIPPTPTDTPVVWPTATDTPSVPPTATGTPAVPPTMPPIASPTPTVFVATCGTVWSATLEGHPSRFANYNCHAGDYSGPDRVVAVVIDDGDLTATLSGLDADLDVFILSALDGASCLAWGDVSASLSGLPAGTYYIAVDGAGGVAGAYTMSLSCTAAPPVATPTTTGTPIVVPTAGPILTSTPTATPTDTPTKTATPTFTPTPTATYTFTPTNTPTPTATHTPTPSTCGFGKLGRPEDKNPYTATIVDVGKNLDAQWWSDGGNGTNWIRIIGNGSLIKLWNDRLNPASTRIWVEIFADPTQPAIVRQECYALSQCWIPSTLHQVYYVKGQIMTDPGTSVMGCSMWNVDDP